jgi:hypothetical protein
MKGRSTPRNWTIGIGALALVCAGQATMGTAAATPAVGPMSTPASGPLHSASTEQRQRIGESYAHLPLYFEKNEGQTAQAVRYLAHGSGYTLFLTADEGVMVLNDAKAGSPGSRIAVPVQGAAPKRTRSSVLRWHLAGANHKAEIAGEGLQPGRSNYLVGKDATHWRIGVEHYGQVRYRQVYPGIDLVYHGTQGHLECDFVVAPGADPDRIRLRYSGQDKLSVNAAGDLVIATASGEVVQHMPAIYQTGANGQREPIEGHHALQHEQLAFSLGPYDHHRSLVIDPVLAYSASSSFQCNLRR